MSDTNLNLDAFTRLEQQFRLAPEVFDEEFGQAMRESVDLLDQLVTEYPPQPPPVNPRRRPYVRTFTLKGSWQTLVEVTRGVVTGRVWTSLSYAKFVQDALSQSRYLAHWRVVQKLAEDAKPEIYFNFRQAVSRDIQRMKG